jgi:hypothetical protein
MTGRHHAAQAVGTGQAHVAYHGIARGQLATGWTSWTLAVDRNAQLVRLNRPFTPASVPRGPDVHRPIRHGDWTVQLSQPPHRRLAP